MCPASKAVELIVLPGLDGTSALLASFCSSMAARGVRARALAYPVDRSLDYEALESYVRERLPRERPFALLGESFSGPLAIRIAASPPDGLQALILSTTFARGPLGNLRGLAFLLHLAPARPPMSLMSYALLGQWSNRLLRTQLAAALLSVQPPVLKDRAQAALSVDVGAELTRVSVPSLYLRARNDRLLSRKAIDDVIWNLPHCELVEIDGPHLLLQTANDAAAQAIASFLLKHALAGD